MANNTAINPENPKFYLKTTGTSIDFVTVFNQCIKSSSSV